MSEMNLTPAETSDAVLVALVNEYRKQETDLEQVQSKITSLEMNLTSYKKEKDKILAKLESLRSYIELRRTEIA